MGKDSLACPSRKVGKPEYEVSIWACSSGAHASDLGMPMQSPIGVRVGNVNCRGAVKGGRAPSAWKAPPPPGAKARAG